MVDVALYLFQNLPRCQGVREIGSHECRRYKYDISGDHFLVHLESSSLTVIAVNEVNMLQIIQIEILVLLILGVAAKPTYPVRRSISCGTVGFDCDVLSEPNQPFCCDPDSDGFPSQFFVQCDPFTKKVAKAKCPNGGSCMDNAQGLALCTFQ